MTVVLYDAQGRRLRTLPQGHQAVGSQRVSIGRAELPAGVVYYGLITERGTSQVSLLVVR